MAYLLLLIGVLILTAVCIDVFTGCMPPKTAWDRTQRRSEEEWILSAKVEFLNSEKGQRDRYKLLGTRNLHLSKRTPENGATTDRTWYLIWEAADQCLLKVVSTCTSCWTVWGVTGFGVDQARRESLTELQLSTFDFDPWPLYFILFF